MKKSILLFGFLVCSLPAFCQGTFTETTFTDFMAQYAKDPVTFWQNTDENFQLITGNGNRMSKSNLVSFAETMNDKHAYSELKVNQSGSTALVSGIIDETMSRRNDPSGQRTYKGIFTSVWAYQQDKWVLMSWQHSDYKP